MKRLLFVLLLVLVLRPISAKADIFNITNKEREEVSKQMLAEIVKVNGQPRSLNNSEKVAMVFYSIVQHTQRKGINYVPEVVINKNINAYALPNGNVVFYSGLIDILPKDDLSPLAFICAHEIAHIERGHADQIIQNKMLWGLGLGLILKDSDKWFRLLGGIAHGLITSGYSRGKEVDADCEGIKLMQKADFDPNGAIVIMDILANASEGHVGLSIFPTHPKIADRRKNILGWLQKKELVSQEIKDIDLPAKSIETNDKQEIDKTIEPKQITPTFQYSNFLIEEDFPQTNYDNISMENIKRGYFLRKWEKRLIDDIGSRMNLNVDWDLKQKARLVTYSRNQSYEKDKMLVLTFMQNSCCSYELFVDYFDKFILPKLSKRKADFQSFNVAVKKNGLGKKHIVIIFSTK